MTVKDESIVVVVNKEKIHLNNFLFIDSYSPLFFVYNILIAIIIILILCGIYYKNVKDIVKTDKSKIVKILYTHEVSKNKISAFGLTNYINKNDINFIVDSLNNGKLKPDKNEIGTYTL